MSNNFDLGKFLENSWFNLIIAIILGFLINFGLHYFNINFEIDLSIIITIIGILLGTLLTIYTILLTFEHNFKDNIANNELMIIGTYPKIYNIFLSSIYFLFFSLFVLIFLGIIKMPENSIFMDFKNITIFVIIIMSSFRTGLCINIYGQLSKLIKKEN